MQRIDQLAIWGTGLLGTSLGLALKARDFNGRVVGLGRREATLEKARDAGAFDAVSTDPATLLPETDLVVVAVPLSGFDAIFAQLAGHQHARMTITDVGSVKSSVVEAAHRHLPYPQRFVGAHPMAGSEQAGPEAADAELFTAKPCVLTPTDTAEPEAVEAVRWLWHEVGMELLTLDAATHDQYAATVSHLPHVAAALLVEAAAEAGGWELASTGFRDATRLASGNPPMWADILAANRQAVLTALRRFREQVQALEQRLENHEDQSLLDWLENQKEHRDAWHRQRFG
jgi:prephenate dehydrogenase